MAKIDDIFSGDISDDEYYHGRRRKREVGSLRNSPFPYTPTANGLIEGIVETLTERVKALPDVWENDVEFFDIEDGHYTFGLIPNGKCYLDVKFKIDQTKHCSEWEMIVTEE